jgi:zinc/manganese transport system ATP-binding protein
MTQDVQVTNVSAHHGSVLAVDGVDATFPGGAVTAITGGNGSGKSTLVAVVAGVHPASRGRVRRPAGGIAFVRQSWSAERPLPLTVQSAVAMGRWRDRGRWARLRAADHELVAHAMAQLGVTDLARRQLGALSGGQRQRVLVAQALAQQAPVLLLDEPTAGVDAPAQRWIDNAMTAEAGRGVAVVHITHDLRSVQQADQHLRMHAGRLVEAVQG